MAGERVRSLLGGVAAAVRNAAPVPYTRSGAGLPWGGVRGGGQLAAMGSVSTLFSIVNRTSNDTSRVDWKLYRKRVDGRRVYGPQEDARREITTHAALDLWNKPNSFMPRQEFVETFQQHIDLVGEGWWIVVRNPRSPLPLELWPVRPDRMEPDPHPTEYLAGYFYKTPDGRKVPLGLDEVIFLRTPNPEDLYRGMGPVRALMVDLEATRAAAEYNRNYFQNGAAPGGVIEAPNGLNDREFERLEKQWDERHRGVRNAHRVALLEKATWKDTSTSQKDMQFAQLRDVSRDIIREAFGINKFQLGLVDDVNRANAEASEYTHATHLLVPRLERIKGALNNDLLPLYYPDGRPDVEFDYVSPVPNDQAADDASLESRSRTLGNLISAGVTLEDALAVCGFPLMSAAEQLPAPAQAALLAAQAAQSGHANGNSNGHAKDLVGAR